MPLVETDIISNQLKMLELLHDLLLRNIRILIISIIPIPTVIRFQRLDLPLEVQVTISVLNV